MFNFFIALTIFIGVWWAWNRLTTRAGSSGTQSGRGARRTARVAASASEPFKWPSLGNFDFDAVGESHYQRALADIAGNHETERAEAPCVAELTPDDDNRHDDKAVVVTVKGETVGYLSRADARSFRRRLGSKGLSGQTTLCDALVVGGYIHRDGERVPYGIKLDMKPFDN